MKRKKVLNILAVTGLFLWGTSAAAASARLTQSIPENYFCMHVHSKPGYEKAFEAVPFRVLRTWDSSIGWPLIEPEKGKWNWELLDRYVELSRKKGARIMLTLGMTPPWASANPDAPSPYGSCCSSAPPKNIEDWKDYIRAVAERNEKVYGGTIRYWEVWNEPDNKQVGYYFYTGTVEELVAMAKAAREVVKAANPDNVVVSPGITQVGGPWLEKFLAAGGRDAVDVIGFHYYWDWYSPGINEFNAFLAGIRDVMKRADVADRPLWLTETGFSTKSFKTPEQQVSELASMLITPWYDGADMTCAYAWNNGIFTKMFDIDLNAPTLVQSAWINLHAWLDGAVMTDLTEGKSKTRVCTLRRWGAMARIAWHETAGRVSVSAEDDWGDTYYTIEGEQKPIPDDREIDLSEGPVLIGGEPFFGSPE